MKNVFQHILIISLVLGLTATPVVVNAMPEPVPATQTDKQKAAAQKQKEKEKAAKQKEKEKAQKAKEKAKAEKEKEKAKAAAAKEKEKAKADKEKEKAEKEKQKAAEQRAQEAAEREAEKARKEAQAQAEQERQVREYEKRMAELENPKPEVISMFNLGIRAGYSAMMDKIQGSYMGAGTLNQSNALQQLKGGGGAGLDLSYSLAYLNFMFETGLDFRFLNSTSTYGFQAQRVDGNYGATYHYLFDNLAETRNMLEIGIPVMFGAQFDRYYFLLGAKFHYGLPMGYSQKGQYDITVSDPALLEPYGLGIHELNGQTNVPIKFNPLDVSLAAEVGIDLDDWLQADPDPKNAKKVKPGERLPFGKEHIHYRVGLFAEYGLLNTNATAQANPVEFAANDALVQRTNTLLAMNGNTKLNNLFVGAKFTIQFEVPGRKPRQMNPPASFAIYSVVDESTGQPIDFGFIETRGKESGKIAMRSKQIRAKGFKQRHAVGTFIAEASAKDYYPASQEFTIEKVGVTQYVTIALKPCPTFRVRVYNEETGQVVPAMVQIIQTGVEDPTFNLQTDSVNGSARQVLTEGQQYSLRIAQMGYETVEMPIANIGDSMNVALKPIKKGDKFVVKNLFFATNKTRILSRSEEALNELFMYLDRNPQIRIKIVGHTDNVGRDEANQKLSEGRANEVMKDLIERGIAPERLEAEGRGESQPIDTNDTEEGRQNNRRVEIEIL